MNRNKKITFSLLAMVALLLGCSPEKSQQADTDYALLSGETLSFAELKGKIVLINYWAEWCSPCREEIPELNALQKDFADQVVVLGVNFDGITGESLQQQATNMGIAFPLLLDDPRSEFGVGPSGVLPETLVINRRGEFQQLLMGPQSLADLQHIVASMPQDMAGYE